MEINVRDFPTGYLFLFNINFPNNHEGRRPPHGLSQSIMRIILSFFISIIFISPSAQTKHDYAWVLGHPPNIPSTFFGGSILDFNQVPPQISYFEISIDMEANAAISNRSGQLEAYTNGCEIMNGQHQLMLHGDQINEGLVHDQYCEHGYPTAQGVIFLTHPGDTSKYGLFHLWVNENYFITRLLYSEIDRSGDDGLGEVIIKNQLILEDTLTKQLTAVRHGNGRDWWIAVPETYRNGYYFILWSPAGFGPPIYQQSGHNWTFQNWSGQAAFSPNGEWYARINPYNEMDLFRFDRCAGELYVPLHISFPTDTMYAAGVAFSSNSRFLYASIQLKIFQFDLWASDISASRVLVAEYDGFSSPFSTTFFQAMLGPDEKIYLTAPNGVNMLHVIHQPNEKGLDCQVEQHGIILPARHSFFTPNFAHYRLLDKPGSPCDTLGINGPNSVQSPSEEPTNLKIWPNPSNGNFTLSLPQTAGRLVIFDPLGREVWRRELGGHEKEIVVEAAGWAPGLYHCAFVGEEGRVFAVVVLVQNL